MQRVSCVQHDDNQGSRIEFTSANWRQEGARKSLRRPESSPGYQRKCRITVKNKVQNLFDSQLRKDGGSNHWVEINPGWERKDGSMEIAHYARDGIRDIGSPTSVRQGTTKPETRLSGRAW